MRKAALHEEEGSEESRAALKKNAHALDCVRDNLARLERGGYDNS